MNTDATQSGSSNQQYSADFSSLSMNQKYGGLIEISAGKKLRNAMYLLSALINNKAKPLSIMHGVVSFIRAFQLYGPSLFTTYQSVWTPGTAPFQAVNIMSILFHLFPITVRDSVEQIALLVYAAIFFVFFFLICGIAVYYRNYAKLHPIVPDLLDIFIRTIGYIGHPIAAQLAGECISKFTMGSVVSALASGIAFAIYLYMFCTMFNFALIFRPDSYPAMDGKVNYYCLRNTCILNFVSGLGTNLPKIGQFVCIGVSLLIYVGSIFIPFRFGAFVSLNSETVYLGICFISIINIIAVLFALILDFSISQPIFFGLLIAFIPAIFIARVISQVRRTKCLAKLDLIEEDNTLFTSFVKRPDDIINLSIPGLTVNHPVCLSWSLFRLGVEHYETAYMSWYVFAKVIHIYPEESQTLEWIRSNILLQHVKGSNTKQLLEQIRTIVSQRESQLSPQLKKKVDSVSKHVINSKTKLRQIWDLVIQGNTAEMESTINKAIISVEKADKEFNQLIEQYPNNRFVARPYARFLKEVKADNVQFAEWNEKVKLLNRGVLINIDHAHELGCLMLPNLPHQTQVSTAISESELTVNTEIDNVIEEAEIGSIDQYTSIQNQIERIRIPAVSIALILLWLFVALIILPPIFIIVYIHTWVDEQNEPLTYMNALSMIRTLVFQVAVITSRYLLENVQKRNAPEGTMFLEKANLGAIDVDGSKDAGGILAAFLGRFSRRQQQIASLPVYHAGNKNMDYVRELVFGSTIPYQFFYEGEEKPLVKNVAINDVIVDYIRQAMAILETDIADLNVDCPQIQNLLVNPNGVTDSISHALDAFLEYIASVQENIDLITLIAQIAVIAGLGIAMFTILYFTIKKLDMTKDRIFNSLVTLPKNVVSSITENLRSIKKDGSGSSQTTEQNTELSKQEDNLMRTFAAASDSGGMSMGSHFLYIVSWLLMIGMMVGIYCVIFNLFRKEAGLLHDNAPHLDNLLGAYGYGVGAYSNLMTLYVGLDPNGYPSFLPAAADIVLSRMESRLEKSTEYWHRAVFGESSADNFPFVGINEGLSNSNKKMNCNNPHEVPQSVKDRYRCMNADTQFQLAAMWMHEQFQPKACDDSVQFDCSNTMFTEIYILSVIALYATFFSPMFTTIVPDMTGRMTDAIPSVATPFAIMAIVAMIAVIVGTVHVLQKKKMMMFTIGLLRFCPPAVVTQTGNLMAILNSDFAASRIETSIRNVEFFEDLIDSMPDAVFQISVQNKITCVNKAAIRDFELDAANVIGTDLKEIMNVRGEGGDITHETKDGTKIHFNVTLTQTNAGGFVIARNQTQTVNHNALIAEERAKSDQLLSSILPPSLVPRVQAGETNISFAVQFATVAFMDIVEFTPWCASNTAATVMSTLNNLFSRFDRIVQSKSTMTRIKCIGDCYMAAGGIFSTVNQPNVHAKEVVEFGLESIAAVEELDREFNLDRRIRVGVNTGGPVVAGVLGIGKPTFEIIGPTIAMAQQMEHHGVAMQVHISRSVYELIYGGDFCISERGQVEIKQGKVLTYLVSHGHAKNE